MNVNYNYDCKSFVHYSRETMYKSVEYFSCNCKQISFHRILNISLVILSKSIFIEVYFYTIPGRMCIEQNCKLRMVNVNLLYTIPERMCTELNC